MNNRILIKKISIKRRNWIYLNKLNYKDKLNLLLFLIKIIKEREKNLYIEKEVLMMNLSIIKLKKF